MLLSVVCPLNNKTIGRPSVTIQKREGRPLNARLPFPNPERDSSEDETAWPPGSRLARKVVTWKPSPTVFKIGPTCNSRLTSRSAENLSSKPLWPLKKKQGKQDLLSLESLLGGTAKSLNSGRKTDKEVAEMVNHDLAELE